MPAQTRAAYRQEIESGRAAADTDETSAWLHLERAHVVAQPYPLAHVASHVALLRLGWRTRDRDEVVGQLVRIVVAAPGSLLGRIPIGNDGRARTPLRATAPIPADLVVILEAVS